MARRLALDISLGLRVSSFIGGGNGGGFWSGLRSVLPMVLGSATFAATIIWMHPLLGIPWSRRLS